MRRLRRLFASLVVALATVAALNGAAALGERWVYGTTWADGGPVGLYRQGADGRRHLAPGARLEGAWYAVHVNTLGFRGPEIVEPKPTGGLRLWCLGGSTTFDIFAPDDATAWPAQLGARLAAALPGRAVDVINAGIPGAEMETNAGDLRALGRRLQPDLVVLYVGPNDLRQVITMTDHTPPPRPGPFDAFAGPRVMQRVIAATGRTSAPLRHRDVSAAEQARLAQTLRDLVGDVRAIGAQPVFVTHAMRAAPELTGDAARAAVGEAGPIIGLDPESTIAAYATWNRVVVEVAAGAPVIDLRAAIPGDAALWGDATHFAAPGSTRAAEILAEGVLRQIGG